MKVSSGHSVRVFAGDRVGIDAASAPDLRHLPRLGESRALEARGKIDAAKVNYLRSDDHGKLTYLSRVSKQMFPYIFR